MVVFGCCVVAGSCFTDDAVGAAAVAVAVVVAAFIVAVIVAVVVAGCCCGCCCCYCCDARDSWVMGRKGGRQGEGEGRGRICLVSLALV